MSQELRQEATNAWQYAKKIGDETKALIDKYPRSATAINAAKRWQDVSNVLAAEWKAWADRPATFWEAMARSGGMSSRSVGANEFQTIVSRGMEIANLYSALQKELLAKREEILAQDKAKATPPAVVKQQETIAKTVNDAVAPGADTPGGEVGGGFLAKIRNLPMAAKVGVAAVVVLGVAWAAGAFDKGSSSAAPAAPAVAGLRRRRRRRSR